MRPPAGKPTIKRTGHARIGFRACDAQDGRQRGGARCEMQKTSAGKFYGIAHALERLPQMRRFPNLSIYLRNARPPEAQPLPLVSRNVGMFRRQLFAEPTPIRWARVGERCRLLALSGRADRRLPRQLSGAKGATGIGAVAAVFDPKRGIQRLVRSSRRRGVG